MPQGDGEGAETAADFAQFATSDLDTVLADYEVRGLPPRTEHGFHIHEKGDCGDNGNASGGHFNPSGGVHGKFAAPGSHAGEPGFATNAPISRTYTGSRAEQLISGAIRIVTSRSL